jgi:hypothetical protein
MKNNIIGQHFGRLTVIQLASEKYNGNLLYTCLCDCGNIKTTTKWNLTSGAVKSCGCLFRDSTRSRKHGQASGGKPTPEYVAWVNMNARCRNKKHPNYRNYGARGIAVCSRWVGSFQNFIDDMGNRPTSKHSIERIDNNGDYCPENCKWATRKEQANNQRREHWHCMVILRDLARNRKEWSVLFDWPHSSFCKQLAKTDLETWVLKTPVDRLGKLYSHCYKTAANELKKTPLATPEVKDVATTLFIQTVRHFGL